ncbi:uncharacterized protein LOC143453307 [Clavelina lepadiformis]|uniref:uncharacterized protein LOC143453307 n=1 Tax=Clavelina lepadiformis TaxID=159417 RepID=UPI004043026D
MALQSIGLLLVISAFLACASCGDIIATACCNTAQELVCETSSSTTVRCRCTALNLLEDGGKARTYNITSLTLQNVNNLESCFGNFNSSRWNRLSYFEVSDSTTNAGLSLSGINQFVKTVKTLVLNNNGLTKINPDYFKAFPMLKSLKITRNNLVRIQASYFNKENFPKLEDLTLNENRIFEIETGIFQGLPLLKRLSLSRNRIELIHNALANLSHLEDLDLSFNRISKVHHDAFLGFTAITKLNLSHNNLSSLNISSSHRLLNLDISFNSFTEMPAEILNMITRDDIGVVKLSGNHLKCDQNMALFFERAVCNEMPISESVVHKYLDDIVHLKSILRQTSRLVLPYPGICVVKPSAEKCLVDSDSNTELCALQSYLDFSASKPEGSSSKIFRGLLRHLRTLYINVKRMEALSLNSDALIEVKQNLVQGLNFIASNVPVNPSDRLVGYIGDDITVGVTEVNEVQRTRSFDGDITTGIGFQLTTRGDGEFVHDEFGNTQSDLEARIDTCSARQRARTNSVTQAEILLPRSVYLGEENQKLVFVSYSDDFLFPSDLTLASSIISADVINRNIVKSKEKIFISADVNTYETMDHKTSYRCAFWNFKTTSWDKDGCQLTNKTRIESSGRWQTRVTCACDHLTNFGILLDFNPNDEERNADVSVIISYIGISLSIIGLIVTIIYRFCTKDLRRGIPQVTLLHLCTSLLSVYMLLLIYDKDFVTQNDNLCITVGVCLHFALLLVWCWQVVEAVAMYRLLVQVFKAKMSYFLPKATAACYGTALLIVTSGLVYYKFGVVDVAEDDVSFYDSYRNGDTCFLSHPSNVYFLIVPVCAGWVINCFAFIVILCELNRSRKPKVCGNNLNVLQSRLRQALGLSSLLSITWFFGFVKVALQLSLGASHVSASVFEIIFALCNSLQGFLIFLLFCASRVVKETRFTKKFKMSFMDPTVRSHSKSKRGSSDRITKTTV